jgi:hypothetical protein
LRLWEASIGEDAAACNDPVSVWFL